MTKHKTTAAANRLLLQGQIAYAEMQAAGVRVDKGYLDATIEKVKKEINSLETELMASKMAREWKKVYGDKMKFGARDQLADMVFNRLKIAEGGEMTKGNKRFKADKSILELVDHPFIKKYLRLEPMKKSLSTNFYGIKKEMVFHDGHWFVHPNHNLHTTNTFRPSGDHPNWKNYPKRDPEIAKLIRPCFIALPGCRFLENDYAQIEVRVPACTELAGDPELRRYLLDKKSDMHRDQAAAVYKLHRDDVSKATRQSVKTNFVFAGFYGSPYYNTAKKLWDDIDRYKLTTVKGTPLKEHLAKKGITSLGITGDPDATLVPGTFVHHVAGCEKKLWERFHVYKAWKRRQVELYHAEGGLSMVTGFAVTGIHSRTEIPNYKIQGPAYHCTLQALIWLTQRFRKYKMKTRVIGEIYDSLQFNTPDKELQSTQDMIREAMVDDLIKEFTWIDVPIEIECDVSPVNGSWYSGKEWIKGDKQWEPKE